jgi:hypothetical protein
MLLRSNVFLLSIFLSALLCSFLVPSTKATSTWSQTYGGTGTEKTRSLVVTPDGGYAVVGFTDSFGAGDRNFWLVKTDALGGMEWNRTYGGAGADEAWGLAVTSDGGYAIAASTKDYFEYSGGDFILIKTDEAGVVPEYPLWLIPPLMLIVTLSTIIYKKRLKRRR